jgi:predicted ATPase
MAEKGDCLIIDEPELNLHPDNQRKIARILVKIANKGINIIISTHSDYIIRELNNLIMLNNDFKDRDKLMQKYNYSEDELLSIEDISAYLFTDNTIRAIEVNRYEGIIAETFDKVINSFNESSDEIFYTLQEEMDCEC